MTLRPDQCALLLIDFQQRLMPAIFDADAVTAEARRLATGASMLDVPIIVTEQKPDKLGPTVEMLAAFADAPVRKSGFDAMRDSPLPGLLPAGRPDIVIAGCEAHICVLQTALGLIAAGRSVFIVRDAVGSRRTESRDAALARLQRHGAEIVTTEMVLFEWLATADHPQFRAISALIK